MFMKNFLAFVMTVLPIMNLASVEVQTEQYCEAVKMKDKRILISG
ncbi:MAG: hypothetical protein ACD_5C00324G0001, partial [uncultured bacterium]